MNRHILKTTTALSLMLLLSACGTSYKMRMEKFNVAYHGNSYCQATDILLDESDTCSKEKDDIDFEDIDIDTKLNAGTTLFLAEKNKISSDFFEAAYNDIQEGLESNGIARGTVEVIANASAVDYSPMIMDSIYMHSYQVLNALKMENKAEAKLQIKRAGEQQARAASKFWKEIEASKNEKPASGGMIDKFKEIAGDEANKLLGQIKKSAQDSTQKVLDDEYKDLNKWQGYTNFVNPYTTYLSGLYFMLNSESKSDIEEASQYLKRTAGMMPNNKFVKEDLALVEKMANGNLKNIDPTTWIIFENGEVANLEEFRLDLPIFLFTDNVKTASISLPKVHQRAIAYPAVSASVNGKNTVSTQTIADVDGIFISEFNKKLPIIIGKSVAKLTMQTALQSIAQQKLGDLGGIAVAAYSVTTAGADLRSWSSLPKNVQIAKIKKGNSDTVTLNIGGKTMDVKVPNTGHSLVYIRATTAQAKPDISVINL